MSRLPKPTPKLQHALRSKTLRTVWAVFCLVWVLATGWLLYSLTFANYGEFDPEQRWLGSAQSIQLNALVPAAESKVANSGLTLVHVRSSLCSCNPLADGHTATVPDDVEQHWVSADTVQAAGFDLPATPAALIFDKGQLIYAGPYASGAFCSVEDSLIDTILTGEQALAGTYLNGLVQACRCLI